MRQQHGSGKTTVLVERIVNKIINENIDIDKLLIVTFTNAAAAEMRERILEAIYKKIDENPDNKNLQKQILLLSKANISTIHSFCLDVIKNYFYEIGISSNFRIGDTSEIELLKQETMEDVFDELYEIQDKEFISLLNVYSGYRDDQNLKNLILKIYNYSQSMPFPDEWINEKVEEFNIEKKLNLDFSKTIWGKVLLEYFIQETSSCIEELQKIQQKLSADIELNNYYETITKDIETLKMLLNNSEWDYIYGNLVNLKFETWPRIKKIDNNLKDIAKEIRDNVKDRIKALRDKIFIYSSSEANEDIYKMYKILKSLEKIILKFSEEYQKNKKEKNIIDFNDIEHYALKILINKNNDGNYEPTRVANIYKEKFVEIAIDEYQDSNLVQEYILNAVSKGNNIFMVGDVKQSIYKFRGARPELFLEKYSQYIEDNNKDNLCKKDTKIKLFENFRSKKNVLDITNMIFKNIMSKALGDIEYNEKEFLNYGAKFENLSDDMLTVGKAELDIIDLKEDIGADAHGDLQQQETDEILLQKQEIEAKFVAKKIKKLIDSNCYIFDKKNGFRKITYKDIVILLRTTANTANIYEKELNELNLPVFSDSSSSYFETEEIQTILAVLKIIDNPNSDIPLVTVMRSPIGNFTNNELVEIRLQSKNTTFYEALCEIKNSNDKSNLKNKVTDFLNMLETWKQKQEFLALDELIWHIYESTDYYNIINSSPNGDLKTANLKLLFEKAKDYEKASFKGLYNFINYIDKISKSTGDGLSAKLIGENENVIRIMSIHKSKGLEFPVVFLCDTGKHFNIQDLNENILLHQDMGFGPKFIDYDRKIEYNTLAKEAIKIKSLNEILSEEMRLLYVALTRAKEKIIITGCDKDLNKSLLEKENKLENLSSKKINISNIRNAKSYLDWIEMVYVKNKKSLEPILDINKVDKKVEEAPKRAEQKKEIKNLKTLEKKEISSKIDKLLNWKYKYLESTNIEGKSSVTDIAKGKKKDVLEITTKPKFIEENIVLNRAEIGTIMHLILQKLDFSMNYGIKELEELIQKLISLEIITENQSKYINKEKILKFTKSDLYLDLKEAKEIQKEKPFYIYISSNEIYHNGTDEKILVQGIIDLYFVDKEGRLILVDYKTDYVANNDEQELINKYKGQLAIYKRALEKALNRKVEAVYIYSIYLDKKIECVV